MITLSSRALLTQRIFMLHIGLYERLSDSISLVLIELHEILLSRLTLNRPHIRGATSSSSFLQLGVNKQS